MSKISDDLAVAQTIVLNAGKGFNFSQKIIDRLKRRMRGMGLEKLQSGNYIAILKEDTIKIKNLDI